VATSAGFEPASDHGSPEELAVARQSASALGRALTSLPSDEATVLILARLEGLSYDDIGGILGRSAAATKQLAYRALTHPGAYDRRRPRGEVVKPTNSCSASSLARRCA
jgi:DNA-directed RNA polymerase specialized sigma24 family protein